MNRSLILVAGAVASVAVASLGACGSSTPSGGPADAGGGGGGGGRNGGGGGGGAAAGDGGLRAFTPPDRSKLQPGQLLLTASGEALAQAGYNFPDTPDDGVFADG